MLGKPKPVDEHEAEGETERVFHEVKQTLRINGLDLSFRTWAAFEKFLPMMWDSLYPNLETRAFESAADRVREEAVHAAEMLGRLNVARNLPLGESQMYQLRSALDMYHYALPKTLMLTSAVRLALRGERIGTGDRVDRIVRGIPMNMYPMEMVSEDPDDPKVRRIFDDIKDSFNLPRISGEYRTLALWPDYLAALWTGIKPLLKHDTYQHSADNLRNKARALARTLPYPMDLSRERLDQLGEDHEKILETTEQFEQMLPPQIINVALAQLDWLDPEALIPSPFPAETLPLTNPQHRSMQ